MSQPVRNRSLASAERFVVSAARFQPIEACELAWSALLQWQAAHPEAGGPVAVFATRQATHDNVWMALASEECQSATFRTRTSVRPDASPVLLFFPTLAVLDDYDADPGTSALFVVESAESPLHSWRAKCRPRDLGTER
ncbi:MAG: hypothetical protein LH650_08045 [Chloroflexi bacterium]|nr:hypothetical protein [Chloroflexota bacterium]